MGKFSKFYICCGFILSIFLCSSEAFAVTIHVPGDYPTIQAAIEIAIDGDIILVQNGTYVESISFGFYPGKPDTSITVQSQNGPTHTIIDGNQSSNTVAFYDTASHNVLDGFTIKNSQDFGIQCAKDTNSTITNCIIINNGLLGINLDSCSATISNCTIKDNGGGIACGFGSSPVISNCIIQNNGDSGISCHENASPTISNCIISGNSAKEYDGGGIFCGTYSHPTITDCTITGNSAPDDGGGIACVINSSPTITNCIISDNTASSDAGGIYCSGNSSPSISNCTITGNWAGAGILHQ